jgi:hypothetical protein
LVTPRKVARIDETQHFKMDIREMRPLKLNADSKYGRAFRIRPCPTGCHLDRLTNDRLAARLFATCRSN